MLQSSLRRLFVVILAFASLSACKVIIELPDGGSCDTCPVRGGVTTEDEMFLLLGSFSVVP